MPSPQPPHPPGSPSLGRERGPPRETFRVARSPPHKGGHSPPMPDRRETRRTAPNKGAPPPRCCAGDLPLAGQDRHASQLSGHPDIPPGQAAKARDVPWRARVARGRGPLRTAGLRGGGEDSEPETKHVPALSRLYAKCKCSGGQPRKKECPGGACWGSSLAAPPSAEPAESRCWMSVLAGERSGGIWGSAGGVACWLTSAWPL